MKKNTEIYYLCISTSLQCDSLKRIAKTDGVFIKLVCFVFLLSITSCGTSFHHKKYKQGYLYGQKKSVQTNDQYQGHDSDRKNDEIVAIENNVSTKNEDNHFINEVEDSPTIEKTEAYSKGVAVEYENDKISVLDEPKNNKQGKPELDNDEKVGKKLILTGGLMLLYLPIVGLLAAAAISNSAALLSGIFVLLFVLFFICVIILMRVAKQFVRHTNRNETRLTFLIMNIVIGTVSILFLLYHLVSNAL